MDQAAPGRRRRVHSAEFKTQAVQASQQPGVSMASVAMAHGINANLLRRWVHEACFQPPIDAMTVSEKPVGFHCAPLMPASPTPPAPSAEPIRG